MPELATAGSTWPEKLAATAPPSRSTTAALIDSSSTSGNIDENRNVRPMGTTKANRNTLRSRTRNRRSLARISSAARTVSPSTLCR